MHGAFRPVRRYGFDPEGDTKSSDAQKITLAVAAAAAVDNDGCDGLSCFHTGVLVFFFFFL